MPEKLWVVMWRERGEIVDWVPYPTMEPLKDRRTASRHMRQKEKLWVRYEFRVVSYRLAEAR